MTKHTDDEYEAGAAEALGRVLEVLEEQPEHEPNLSHIRSEVCRIAEEMAVEL